MQVQQYPHMFNLPQMPQIQRSYSNNGGYSNGLFQPMPLQRQFSMMTQANENKFQRKYNRSKTFKIPSPLSQQRGNLNSSTHDSQERNSAKTKVKGTQNKTLNALLFGRKRIPDLGREQFVVVVAQLLSERLLFLVVPDVHASKPLQKRAEPTVLCPPRARSLVNRAELSD